MNNTQSGNKNILMIGRDDWQKDEALNLSLLEYLNKQNHNIIWEGHVEISIFESTTLDWTYKWLPNSIKNINKKIIRLIYSLFDWNYFRHVYSKNNNTIEFRCRQLRRSILKLGTKKELIIISRSSGGRVASIIADKLRIKHIICLGYPFKHPEKRIEPDRFLHLMNLKTPMLIIQGTKDEYGGLEVKEKYALSPAIEVLFVDANHDFKTSDEDWEKVILKISSIIDPI